MMTKAQTRTVGGAKVTINETASEALVAAAAQEVTVTDSTGRAIRLKKPGVLAQFRLVEALGESARNEVYLAMVTPMIFIAAIDEAPVTAPTSKTEVEALIQRLDEPGIEAVMLGVQEHFAAASTEAAAKNG